jgi:hypothetical protein
MGSNQCWPILNSNTQLNKSFKFITQGIKYLTFEKQMGAPNINLGL